MVLQNTVLDDVFMQNNSARPVNDYLTQKAITMREIA